MSESAWKFGPYVRGMGMPDDDPRMVYAVRAIKQELVYLGYTDVNLDTDRFGPNTYRAVKAFQTANQITVDGMVGRATASALWRRRILVEQLARAIPDNWLRAQIHWESADDPGAQFTNPDGSRDRGLIQSNTGGGLSDDSAFDPSVAIPLLASYQKAGAREYRDCQVDRWRLAVGRWRTPVGALEWCNAPDTQPDPEGTWGQKAVFYVGKVDSDGRLGWTG